MAKKEGKYNNMKNEYNGNKRGVERNDFFLF